jgi:hypothetical protein
MKRLILFAIACAAILITANALLTGYAVRAQSRPEQPEILEQTAPEQPVIEILELTTESSFRRYMRFEVRARSTTGSRIVGGRFLYRAAGDSSETAERLPDFIPAEEVTLRYTWNTRDEATPPWQLVTYRWELVDEAGNVFRMAHAEAEMTDDTRSWETLGDGRVRVYWYDQREDFGERLLDAAQRGFAHIEKATGYTPERELRIVMYNDFESFCSVFPSWACQEWYAGVTFGNMTVQYLIPGQRRFVINEVVPHELAHAFLQDWMGLNVQALPRWFDEGQATNNQLEGIDREIERARFVAMNYDLIRLPVMNEMMIGYRDDSDFVADWYAQSASLVAFLYERWGTESLGEIVSMVKEGQRFERALQTVTGLTLEEYELAWREWLGATIAPPTLVPTMTFPAFLPSPTYEPTPSGAGN